MVTSVPPVTESEKREALQSALRSDAFARSAQLRSLLQYICERELAGQAAELTEYQIAVDVLARRKDFNLTEDSTVRNRVYELRQRLDKYYSVESPSSAVHIHIPRGGYVPYYTRQQPVVPELQSEALTVERPVPIVMAPARRPYRPVGLIALGCLLLGALGGWYFARPRPAAILTEAWGPLAQPGDEMLIAVATSLHMIVRPHIIDHPWRFAAPPRLVEAYGPNRPLPPGTPLYMEPAQISVPLAELAAASTISNMRTTFGGGYQILPEAEAPVGALRGRNAVLLGSGTNSQAAKILLYGLPWTIDYDNQDRFAVLDQRKPAGQNALYVAQSTGQPVPTTIYGLLTVLTSQDAGGRQNRTVVLSGTASGGVQAAAEFFCSPTHMRELKEKMHGFPAAYQVIVRCKASGVRLISYEYAGHEVGSAR